MSIVGGKEIRPYRGVAFAAVDDINHILLHEMGVQAIITKWDYERDRPTVVAKGALPQRSLEMVGRSELLLALFGPTIPPITSKELREAFRRRQDGEDIDIHVLLDSRIDSTQHEQLFKTLESEFNETIVWRGYRSKLDVYRGTCSVLLPFVLKRVGLQTLPESSSWS